MKLLIITSMYPPYIKGGGEISTSLLAEHLVNLGVDVSVLTIADEHKCETINGVKVIRIPPPNTYWSYYSETTNRKKKIIWHFNESYNMSQGSTALKYINNLDFDLIQTSVIEDFSPNLWRLLKQTYNKKIIHTLRSYYLTCYKGNMYKENNDCKKQCNFCKVTTFLKKRNSSYVDQVVGISNDILERHLKLGYFKNSTNSIIPNSYELSTNNLLKDNDENNENFNFGFIGKLDYHKGIKELLDVFTSVEIQPNVKLIIAGFGPLEEYVKVMAARNPKRISFIGRVNPHQFYSKIDVNIVPSLWNEPFGRVIIESFSYGIPVIASKKGGIPEIVNDKKTGRLFNDINELPALIIEYYNMSEVELNNFKRNCLKDSENYQHLKIAQKYLDVYRQLLGL